MATVCDASPQVCDVTECSICLETFKEPKALPCIHTFCLECLDTYCEDKEQGEEGTCPLCRKVFLIPPGGVKNLSNNVFIHQLLEINKSTVDAESQESDKEAPCELCSDTELETPSTSYCIECDQHICDRCAGFHNKIKLFRSHQVVLNADIPSSEERIKLTVSYCDQHPSG